MWGLEIVAVLVAECVEVGLNTMSKAAMRRGMNNFIYSAYSTSLGVLFLVPLAFFFHRITSPPPMLTFSTLSKISLLGAIGYCVQMCMYLGIQCSSPTLASALTNLTPAFTFILARISGMEKLDLKSKSSQAKCIGTIVSILGAFTVTFYKGPPIIFGSPSSISVLHEQAVQFQSPVVPQQNWVIGGFLIASGSFILAILIIVQTWIMKDYPAPLMVTLLGNSFTSILATAVALILERDPNAWKLRSNIELVTIVYAAIFMVSLRNIVLTWLVRDKGPVFVTMFKPLGIVIALVMGIAFLGDTLYLGSVTGALIIAIGFYSVLWGKAEEEKAVEEINGTNSFGPNCNTNKFPLLQKESTEEA
ncbi:WAT1-related protein At3g28050-like [Rhododendron vialii]|uniref:WAT1-related protein At3g28050-like n=1 Tax=Rhododendron vialii TaxID=182163 RepID=UPI00265E12E7|nr:WAT1-related protein At3g28050-like [Rhododendron vialii]